MRDGRVLAILAVAIGVVAVPPAATSADERHDLPDADRRVERVDRIDLGDDLVRPSGGAATTVGGEDRGYLLIDPAWQNAGQYRVRLVDSRGIRRYRPMTEDVVDELNEVLGPYFTFAPRRAAAPADPADFPAVRGEIRIIVNDLSPCGFHDWLGCAELDKFRTINAVATTTAGRIWLHPTLVPYNGATKREVIAHEIGHVLGLDHYDARFRRRFQVMRSFVDGRMTSWPGYRAGDVNGLRDAVGPPPANDTRKRARWISPIVGRRDANNWFATAETGDPELTAVYPASSHRSVWFRFKARPHQVGKTFVLATSNDGVDDFNTVIGHVTNGRVAAHDNDGGPGKLSRMTLTPTNTTDVHHIVVDGMHGRRGVTQLTMREA